MGLLECYQLASSHASQIAQNIARGGATDAALCAALALALDVTADILSWQFGSWSAANFLVYPPETWRPQLLASAVPAALFALYGALRAEAVRRSLFDAPPAAAAATPPQRAFEADDDALRALLRNARRCMTQFASLHGRKLFANDDASLVFLAALIPGVGALAAASAASVAHSAAAAPGSGAEDDADGGGFVGDEATDTSVMVLRLAQNFGFSTLTRAAGVAELLATFSSLAAQLLRADAAHAAAVRAKVISDVAAQPAAERPTPTELYARLAGEWDQSWRMRAFDMAFDCWGLLAVEPLRGEEELQSVASALQHQAAALASQLVGFRLELSRGAAAATADAVSRGVVRDSAGASSSSAAAVPTPPPTKPETDLLVDSDADDERPSLSAVSGREWYAEQTEAAAFLGRLRPHDSMTQLAVLLRERAATWGAAQRGGAPADGGVASAAAACELACVLLSASCTVADMPAFGERPTVPQKYLADDDGGRTGGTTPAETAATVNGVLAISSELLQLAGSVLEWLSRAPDAVAFTWANRILLRALLLFLLRWSATYLTMERDLYPDNPLPAALHSAFIVPSTDPLAPAPRLRGGVPALTATATSAVNLCVQARCILFYRYNSRESCSQFDSLPLTSLTISLLHFLPSANPAAQRPTLAVYGFGVQLKCTAAVLPGAPEKRSWLRPWIKESRSPQSGANPSGLVKGTIAAEDDVLHIRNEQVRLRRLIFCLLLFASLFTQFTHILSILCLLTFGTSSSRPSAVASRAATRSSCCSTSLCPTSACRCSWSSFPTRRASKRSASRSSRTFSTPASSSPGCGRGKAERRMSPQQCRRTAASRCRRRSAC